MGRKAAVVLAALVMPLAILAAACDDDDVDDAIDDVSTEVSDTIDDTQTEVSDIGDDDDTPAEGGAEGSPSVTIDTPEDGDTDDDGDVDVEVSVGDFEVVDKLGEPPVEGEGHVHFYLDAEPPTTPGQPAVTEEGTYHAEATTEHTWEDVAPGTHTFSVQLVNNDHTPLEPAVVARVTVEVEAGE
jgi:hypothetical protein